MPRQNLIRADNGSILFRERNVDNFVTAKAPNFNKIQQASTSRPQTLQHQSLRINRNPYVSIRLGLLHAKGRIRLRGNVREWAAEATKHLREAPLTHEIVVAAQELPLSHPDPADRFLVATVEVLELTLVTADQRLLGLGKIATLANH